MRILILLSLLCPLWAVAAPVTPTTGLDPVIQRRFQHMIAELRCLVCQNQSLAESDAGLAKDLRNEVLVMMQQGQSDDEILTFLVDRYGDFILYRPPFKVITVLLWLGPLLLLAGGFFFWARALRQHAKVKVKPEHFDEAESARLQQLLARNEQEAGQLPLS